jgi:hypothetical protein
MTAHDLFLGMVLAAFAAFTLTLGGVSAWLNLTRPSSDNA